MWQILACFLSRVMSKWAHHTVWPFPGYYINIHIVKMVSSQPSVSQSPSFLGFTTYTSPLRTKGEAEKTWLRVEGIHPFFPRNVIPSHCWPLLTPPPRDTPLPRCYANLCCALNRCPNNSLSGGGGGKLGLWREKNAAIFMAGPDYHTAEDLYLGGGRRFRHTFPTIQISWVVKKRRWKGLEGGRGWGVSRSKKPVAVLCRGWWALSEGTPSHTGSAVLVQTQYVLSHSHCRSTSLPQRSPLK